MRARSTALSRGQKWIVLWALLFAGLVVLLPRRPVRRVESTGPISLMRFADSNTLLLRAKGFSVLDLRDGSLRELPEPVYNDLPAPDGESAADQERTIRYYDQLWSSGGEKPRFGLCGITGDSFALTSRWGDGMRLSVRNVRTGQETFHRDYPNGEASAIAGRVYVEWVTPGTGRARLDAWDLRTGEGAPTPDSPEHIRLTPGATSPDGRYLGVRQGGKQLRLLSLESGQEQCQIEADQYAFSSDSRLLAALLHHRPRTRGTGTLRVHEVATGKLLAEHGDIATTMGEQVLSFYGEDRTIAIHTFRMSGRLPQTVASIDVWRWQEDSLQTLPSPSGFQGTMLVTDRLPGASRFVLDGQQMIDVETAAPICTVATPDPLFMMAIPGWGVFRSRGGRLADRIAAIAKPYSTPLADWLASGDAADLCDLTTGRIVAGLGKGRLAMLFSPDGKWLATADRNSIEIWQVPPSRPWLMAFTISLIGPAVAALSMLRRRQRERSEPVTAS